jgi:cytochrome P450
MLSLGCLVLLLITSKTLYEAIYVPHKIRSTLLRSMPTPPTALPFVGHVLDMLHNTPWDLMTAWHEQLGSVYAFSLFNRPCVSVADPKMLRGVLHTHHALFKKDIPFTYEPFMPLLGRGLVTSDGKQWQDQRVRLSKALRIDILEDIPGITLRAVQRFMAAVDEKERTSGGVLELGECFRHLTLQVISEALLSLDATESDKTFANMYLPIVEEGNMRIWNPLRKYAFFCSFWWRHRRNIRELNGYIEKLVRERKSLREREHGEGGGGGDGSSGRRQDVLDRCISNYEGEGAGWSEDAVLQLRDEIKTFILAGHETSAAMLTWAVHELVAGKRASDLVEKVRREGEGVWKAGSCEGWSEADLPSRTEQLSKLEMSEACLKEALRRYSVVPTVTRTVSEDIELEGHTLKKGTTVMVGIQGVHMDERWWKGATEFRPERFSMGEGGEAPPVVEPYTFLPFIDGPRNCLGQYLSLLESKMVLSLLFKEYSIEPVGGMPGGEKHEYMVPVVPRHGIVVKMVRRRS